MTVSKSRFKARALEYFRQVERTGEPLVITDRGKPVVRITAMGGEDAAAVEFMTLRGSVLRYDDPDEPVGTTDWDLLR